MEFNWKYSNGGDYDWERSFSEPNLADPFQKLNRFIIKHPHEYISVDDLKFFRRKKPPDEITKSSICFNNDDEKVLPFSSLKTEYRRSFRELDLSLRPQLIRRTTSLRLDGLMNNLSEHREQYHWYSPNDWQSCRGYAVRNPENLRLSGDFDMDPEYRSSYISYPMVDRTMKILPREVFHINPDSPQMNETNLSNSKNVRENAVQNRLAEEKFKRDVAAKEQNKSNFNRKGFGDTNYNTMPSEYKRQFVQYPIEKAHSIPQLSHIKMQGEFYGIPEYQDSFKMYANYSKSAPIKKQDNLTMSGSEMPIASPIAAHSELPEYQDKFCSPPKDIHKEKREPLKTVDHLHPQGEFSKVLPEYHESFRDPQVKAVPERGKCREPYLRLKGKIDFNPEYRNTYLDFPRARPVIKKPISTFRLPMSRPAVNSAKISEKKLSPRQPDIMSPPKQFSNDSEPAAVATINGDPDIVSTPEYRRALTHYQLRERTPTRKVNSLENENQNTKGKFISTRTTKASQSNRKSSDSSYEISNSVKPLAGGNALKKRQSRNRQPSILETEAAAKSSSFENIGQGSKKTARFGRRASVLQNAAKCREKSSIVEGNPKYTAARSHEAENNESFLVLDEPCKRSNWMKKSWYDS